MYLARQEALDRLVAVKVIRQPIDDSKVWRNFQREAQAIARLSGHAHVIWVFTAGRTDSGQPYLVTEYLDRGSLDDVLADVDGELERARVRNVRERGRLGDELGQAVMQSRGHDCRACTAVRNDTCNARVRPADSTPGLSADRPR